MTASQTTAFLESAMVQYGKATYNFAYLLTGNDAEARDLTQEAFIRAYRAGLPFEPGSSVLSWMYRIVMNVHRDERRRQNGRVQDGYKPSPSGGPLIQVLAQLSSDERHIVVLADIEKYSYQQIADIIGCSTETVRSRLHRARASLRRLVLREPQHVEA